MDSTATTSNSIEYLFTPISSSQIWTAKTYLQRRSEQSTLRNSLSSVATTSHSDLKQSELTDTRLTTHALKKGKTAREINVYLKAKAMASIKKESIPNFTWFESIETMVNDFMELVQDSKIELFTENINTAQLNQCLDAWDRYDLSELGLLLGKLEVSHYHPLFVMIALQQSLWLGDNHTSECARRLTSLITEGIISFEVVKSSLFRVLLSLLVIVDELPFCFNDFGIMVGNLVLEDLSGIFTVEFVNNLVESVLSQCESQDLARKVRMILVETMHVLGNTDEEVKLLEEMLQ